MEEQFHLDEPVARVLDLQTTPLTGSKMGLIACLFGITTCDRDSEKWLGFLGRLDFEGLCGLGRVVIAPEPDHFGGKFGGALAAVVGAFAETEMEVVLLEL